MTREEIINLFVENVVKVAAEPIRMSDGSELNGTLAKLLTESDRVFCPSVTETEKVLEFVAREAHFGLCFGLSLCGRGICGYSRNRQPGLRESRREAGAGRPPMRSSCGDLALGEHTRVSGRFFLVAGRYSAYECDAGNRPEQNRGH